ncbi:hypothetical protein GCM10009096_03700 [Parasphingorhabdus litoris]|uniref:Uncharacterized protein n=1 Tax=Parasphingorhabdus litoris TaxID=394733 RepID=A0ABN1A2Y7_9SPHN
MGQPDEDPTAPDTRVVSLLTKLARVANGQLHSRIRIGNIGKDSVIQNPYFPTFNRNNAIF